VARRRLILGKHVYVSGFQPCWMFWLGFPGQSFQAGMRRGVGAQNGVVRGLKNHLLMHTASSFFEKMIKPCKGLCRETGTRMRENNAAVEGAGSREVYRSARQ